LLKEYFTTTEPGPGLFEAAVDLLRQAGAHKVSPDEVRAWAERAVQAGRSYGDRLQAAVGLRVVQALAGQPEYAAVALDQAQRTARLLEPSDDPAVQLPILEALARVLRQAGKAEEVKDVLARIATLEERESRDFAAKVGFRPEKFAGRRAKSERAVLLEVFTGAESPPCVAADLAADAVTQAYPPSDVVVLEYHLHIPGPDPLTNPASEARAKYYAAQIADSTPAALVNGKGEAGGGGGLAAVKTKFLQYKAAIDPLLETPARARLQVTAERSGETVTISARVGGLAKTGRGVRLRLALVEESVRYRGGNGIRYHHHVVRAFAGGPDGIPLTQASSEHQVSVNLDELRGTLNAYLDKYQKDNEGLTFSDRPLGLRKLRVVAFVQDDAIQDVLQAVQVEVK
jgi:hypothetical protein